jgi:hypothetical protein
MKTAVVMPAITQVYIATFRPTIDSLTAMHVSQDVRKLPATFSFLLHF